MFSNRFRVITFVCYPHKPSDFLENTACRPYRAPETIFGPTDYDPYAVDLWSAAATIAGFFTPLRFVRDDEDDAAGGYSSSEEDIANGDAQEVTAPFVNLPGSQRGSWSRDSLFDAQRGSIGLAWSIFKIRGTPNVENWPVR